MTNPSISLITKKGQAKIATMINMGQGFTLSFIVVGQGPSDETSSFEVSENQVNLYRECHRLPIDRLIEHDQDPGRLTAQATIGANVGGWTIREIGIIDSDGDLFAVASVNNLQRPQNNETPLLLNFSFKINNADGGGSLIGLDPNRDIEAVVSRSLRKHRCSIFWGGS